MIKHDILNRITGAVQFTAEIECEESASVGMKVGLSVRWALKTNADLVGAYLADANLADANLARANLARANLVGANLARADLIDGGQRSDGYRFVGWINNNVLQIRAGCRSLNISEARAHWIATRANTPLGAETMAILDHIEAVARIRGLITDQKSEAA